MEKEPLPPPPRLPDERFLTKKRVTLWLAVAWGLGMVVCLTIIYPPHWLTKASGKKPKPVVRRELASEPKVEGLGSKMPEVWHKEVRAGLELEVPVVLESLPAPLLEKMIKRELWWGRTDDRFGVGINFVEAGRVANPSMPSAVLTMAQTMVKDYGAAVSEITQEEVKIAGVPAVRVAWAGIVEGQDVIFEGLVLQDAARTWYVSAVARNPRRAADARRVLGSVRRVLDVQP